MSQFKELMIQNFKNQNLFVPDSFSWRLEKLNDCLGFGEKNVIKPFRIKQYFFIFIGMRMLLYKNNISFMLQKL
ncbi:hypothetical protein ACEE67_00950 [Streptococcus thoraltensis]